MQHRRGMVKAAPGLNQLQTEVFLKCRFKDIMLLKFVGKGSAKAARVKA